MNVFKLTKRDFSEMMFKKPFLKRMLLMLVGVTLMGICVSVLRLCHLGTDPYSALNYGLEKLLGIEFGTLELLFNGIMMIIVIFFDVSRLGFGTLGNMILVGYTADLTTLVTEKLFGVTELDGMAQRVIVMLIALTVFVFGLALYINAGLGGSAYDALPYIIHDGISRKTKKIPFTFVRMAFDGVFTVAAFLLDGEAGIITVLMVLTLGPVIELVAKLLSKVLKTE